MRFYIDPDGRVSEPGVQRGKINLHAITKRYIILRIEGSAYWAGIGVRRGYAPAHFMVLQPTRVEKDEATGRYEVVAAEVAGFPVRQTASAASVASSMHMHEPKDNA